MSFASCSFTAVIPIYMLLHFLAVAKCIVDIDNTEGSHNSALVQIVNLIYVYAYSLHFIVGKGHCMHLPTCTCSNSHWANYVPHSRLF